MVPKTGGFSWVSGQWGRLFKARGGEGLKVTQGSDGMVRELFRSFQMGHSMGLDA